jgi:hypothetical protein
MARLKEAGFFCFGEPMTRTQIWKQGNDYCIRTPKGEPINLNTPEGAAYVVELQRRLAELEKPKRRRKAGPTENKDAVGHSA